jgi:hypothetical protein
VILWFLLFVLCVQRRETLTTGDETALNSGLLLFLLAGFRSLRIVDLK